MVAHPTYAGAHLHINATLDYCQFWQLAANDGLSM